MLRVEQIIESAKHTSAGLPDGRYVALRPIQLRTIWSVLHDAWEVIRGRADAVKWEGQ